MIIKHEIRAAFESILDILNIHETEWEEVTEEFKNDYRCTKKFVKRVVEKSFIDMNDPNDPDYYPCYQWNHLPNEVVRELLKKEEEKIEKN